MLFHIAKIVLKKKTLVPYMRLVDFFTILRIIMWLPILIMFMSINSFFSQNIVPNPSFEDTNYCPFFLGDLTPIVEWESFGNTPDCFHTCSSSTIQVPNNSGFGYQYPRSGNSMVGIITYVWEQDPGWPNYREYIGAQLLEPLEIGEKYYISFYINCAGYIPNNQHIGSNKTGVRFYENLPSTNIQPNNFSHVYSDSIITDTVNWYKIQGSIIADNSYQYIVIGNFFNHLQTDTIIFGGDPFGGSSAYYYIDDVCVSKDSCDCNTCEVLPLLVPNVFTPNQDGINDYFKINGLQNGDKVSVFNRWGQLIFRTEDINEFWDGMTSNGTKCSEGVYYYIIEQENSGITKTGTLHLKR
jgi:gliding motility-associated-like protein